MTPLRLPTFWLKAALALGVAAAADALLFGASEIGAGLGVVALGLVAALASTNPAIRRSRLGLAALAAAAAFAAVQLDRPSFVAVVLFALSVGIAALAPRAPAGDDVLAWLQRLAFAAAKGLIGPVLDLRRVLKARARRGGLEVAAVLVAAVVPVLGGIVFIFLFTTANPVLARAFERYRLPEPDLARLVFWGVFALIAWMALRPRGLRRAFALPAGPGGLEIPIATPATIALSLTVFNAIFAVQNLLDAAFLWSGARLPQGVTFAEYAHSGAYPLILTALLAALFVLVFLQPGSRTAASPLVRGLVIAWIGQNLFLVASTMLRTLDYIDAYSLTRMRIAALLWMGLVASGLVLIAWRLMKGRSAGWLINANAAAAAAVLAACAVVDLGAVAAAWNVRHAREAGGRGVALDLGYFRNHLGGAGVVALAELERRSLPADVRCEVSRRRRQEVARMAVRQVEWRAWRWRDARRLARVEALTGERPMAPEAAARLTCPGDPPPRPIPPAPLTPPPKPGT